MSRSEELYQSYPVRQFEYELDSRTGRVIILRPKYRSALAKKLFEPWLREKFFRIKLDDIGSTVWLNCDGGKTVAEIERILEKKFGLQEKELDKRLRQFIIQLSREKFITLRIPAG